MRIITTCSKTKAVQALSFRQLRTYAEETHFKSNLWRHALNPYRAYKATPEVLWTGEELYTGPSHKILRDSMPKVKAKFSGPRDPFSWSIISAGYGLIDAYARILHPYDASFAPGLDGVGSLIDCRLWYEDLGLKSPFWMLRPKPIPQEHASVMIVASPTYLLSAEDDICDLIHKIETHGKGPDDGQLVIVTTQGLCMPPEMRPYIVEANMSMTSCLNANANTLNAKAAAYLLENLPTGKITPAKARAALTRSIQPSLFHLH